MFPTNNFPFSCLTARLTLISVHSPCILEPKPRREDTPKLNGLLSWGHLQRSPPLDFAQKLKWALGRDSPFALLDWHPYQPTFHPLLTRATPFSQTLACFLPSPSARQEDPRGPRTLGLVPHLIWNRGCTFQSRLLLLSEEVLRTGMPSLSPFSLLSPPYSATMGHSQSQTPKSPPLGLLLQNLKALDFQGEIRPKRLIYYSNTVWPQFRLYNRSQWPERNSLNYNTL